MLSSAQMKSNVDDVMSVMPLSLKASCPHLRRSFRSTRSPAVMCDLRRHMVPHGGLGCASTSAPWDGVTFSWDVICSWSQRLYFGTNLPVAYRQPSDSASCCNVATFSSLFASFLFSGLLHLLHYHFLVPCNLSYVFDSTLSRCIC